MGTSLRVISFPAEKLKVGTPVEVAPPTGATHLIKHTSDQIRQQAAKRVDHDGPEKVQHRHHLLSEVVPTAALYRAGRGKASGLFAPEGSGCCTWLFGKNFATVAESENRPVLGELQRAHMVSPGLD